MMTEPTTQPEPLSAEERLRAQWGRCDQRGFTHTHSGPCPEEYQAVITEAIDAARAEATPSLSRLLAAVDAIFAAEDGDELPPDEDWDPLFVELREARAALASQKGS